MATIIPQISLFDYTKIEILGDLVRLKLALDNIDDEALVSELEKRRGNGRNDYPIRALWNSLIACIIFGHRTIASLRRELSRNSQLRRICGFNDDSRKKYIVPPARVYSGFISLLISSLPQLREMFSGSVLELAELLPNFGNDIAGDGKYVDSYAKTTADESVPKTDRRSDTDGTWSKKVYNYTDANGKTKEKVEYHFGFRLHIICDVATELPISITITPANTDEKSVMIDMLSVLPGVITERAKSFELDRGYDSIDMIKAIKAAGIAPIIDIRNCWKDPDQTKQYKNTNMVYDYHGSVYFVDDKGIQHKMKYAGYDSQKKCLRYSHEGKIYKIYTSYDERIFLPIARDSAKWKRLYNGRTSIERLNGRLDRDFGFEDHCIRGLEKMSVMVLLSTIIMNSMAIGKIKQGSKKNLAAFTRLPFDKAG